MGARWSLRGECAPFDAVRARLADWESTGRSAIERIELLGSQAWLKGSPFRGRSRLRHVLRRCVLGAPYPRLKEYDNLLWLREHGFGAPRPLAAGARLAGGLPRYQFLLTEEWPAARPLDDVLATEERDTPERVVLFERLAAELARMHELGFVHRDFYPRNVLARGAGDELELAFLDAWRGGVGPGLRGASYDLACWMLAGAVLLSRGEQESFCQAYARARGAVGERALARLPAERERLWRSLELRAAKGGRAPVGPREWRLPGG